MAHQEDGKIGPSERKSSLRPPAVSRRDSQAAALMRGSLVEPLPEDTAHTSAPEQRMRHDGRSALHSIVGFVELLESEALGAMSMEQQLSLVHIKSSAARLFELLESSLDVAQADQLLPEHQCAPVAIARLVESTVRTLAREQPARRLLFEGPAPGERVLLHSDPEALRRLVRALVEAIARDHEELWLWLAHNDLHVMLTVGVAMEEHERSVTRSVPSVQMQLAELQAAAQMLNNRDYVRLKRCEALASRQRARLLVSPDLSRVRVMWPKHV